MDSRRRTGSVLAAVLAAISALAVVVAGGGTPATAAGTVASTVTVTSTVNPSVYGQTINVTAKVTGGSGTPTGSVTFVDGSTSKSKTLDASGVGTWSTSFSVGTHSITASYAGDSVYAASTSATYAQVSNQTPTSTTLTASANPVAFGSPVTLTAFVAASAPGNGSPSSGSVKFYDGTTQIGSGTPSSGTVSLVVSNLAAGTHNLTATFGGSTSYLASTSTVLPLVVGTTATTTTLIASANPAPFGASVTFTAAVAAGAGTPTGTVTFLDGTTTIGTATLASGQAGVTLPNLAVGSHPVTAVYAGAGGFSGSTSAVLTEVIDAGPTTTTLTAAPNPAAPGAAVTLTATVAGGAGSPTGTVTFLDGATVLGTGPLAGGQATLVTSTLTVGDHSLTAQYGGSSVDAASTSAPVVETVATLSPSTTTLAAAPNPAALGAPVTLTATVSGTSGTPTGTVTFRDGATVLGTGPVAAGQATLVTSALAGGTHALTAGYGGDATYAPSASTTVTETVTVPATSTSLTASPNPATAGSAVTLTATVTSSGGTPTGTVTFLDGTVALGTGPLAGGQASITVSTLAAGTHPLTASYAATAGFGASVSPVVSETVNPGNVLYVSKAAGCSDSGAGTAAKPFCTIGAASKKATAGYTVVVAAGTYPESVTVANSGTAAAPITFTAAAGATVTLTGGTYGFTMSSKSWIVVRGFTVTATVSSGINVSGGTNVTIDGNHVTAVGQPVSGKTAVGIKLSSTTQALVVNNTTDHNSDAGVYMTGSNANTIRNNVSYANARGYTRAAAGFDVRNGTGNQIYRNVSHDNEDSGFNAWTGTSYGSNAFFDNVAYSNGDHGIDVHNATDARVVANTIVGNYDSGIEATTSTGTVLANNVSINNGINSARTSGNIRIDKGSVATTTVNDDLVFLRVPGVMVDWNGVKYSSLAAFRAATGQESRGIEADPRFAATASADFHLLAGSPAIDSANSGAPNQPATDFDGNGRVDDPATANTGIGPIAYADRGAFEFRP